MKAILYKHNSDNQIITRVGNDPENRRLTKEYKSFASLYRYRIVPMLKKWDGRLTAEIWNNWDNRYKEPDRVMSWNTHIFSK